MRALWGVLASLRTTAVLIAVLSTLLLLNVLLPQAGLDPAAFARAVRSSAAARFVLTTLGLGDLPTSAIFLAVLALFFANLSAALLDRVGATARRLRTSAASEGQAAALLRGAEAIPAPPGADEVARRVLETLGYEVCRVAPGVFWGVKHRLALLGFAMFHAAFFVLAAGALMLYLTRDVVTVVAAEGQSVTSEAGARQRRARVRGAVPVAVQVERVDVSLRDGKPVDLSVAMRLAPDGGVQRSRVNHPAVWGDLTALVNRAGVAPVLWLTDDRGFTLDRVAVLAVARGGFPARARLGSGDLEAVIEPIPVGAGFPERAQLPSARIALRLRQGEADVFEGTLAPGESVPVAGGTVRLQEVRYWAELKLVRERGGGWLIAGFVLSVAGIAWRVVWPRQEIAVSTAGGSLRIGGRSELYPRRFQADLAEVRRLVVAESRAEEDA